MYNNQYNYPINSQLLQNQYLSNSLNPNSPYDDRIFAGGFAAPFLLGGLTGALVAPYFARPPQSYYYNTYYPQYYYRPYPRYYY